MSCTKAEAAAVAYHAIHEQLGNPMTYEDKLRFVHDVVEILLCMSEAEINQHIESKSKQESKVVE